jgi:hypothetical protein
VVRAEGGEDSSGGRMSAGAVVGAVVGSLIGVGLIAVAAVWGWKLYMAKKAEPSYLELHGPSGVDDGL